MKFPPIFFVLAAFSFAGAVPAATINVPADQSTIQAAINAASNGDTVLVAPGTYYEQLDFLGKAISVMSSGGAAATILDGGGTHRLVTFQTHEGNGSVLQGFTLTHAMTSDAGFGAAITLSSTSPTIIDNVFVYDQGGDGYSGAAIYGYGAPVILRNFFADNTCGLQANSSVVAILSGAAGVIADNVFADNPCPALDVSLGSATTAKIYNNTIVGNRAGLIVSSYGTNAATFFSNNLIAFNQYGVQVTLFNGNTFPTWSHNLVYGNMLADYQGVANQTGTAGNISADPVLKYWLSGDVHLLSSSPAIDAGDASVSQASATDFYGNTRVFDGDGDGTAVVDIGAAESITRDDVPGVPTVINVPADYPTIQAGIDAASVGDEVLVAPGTYYEVLSFNGKSITVMSSGGPGATILDGNNSGPIVSFIREGFTTILQGFTFARAKVGSGGAAINIGGPAAPTIQDNVFMHNVAYGAPAISMFGGAGAPVILRNYFADNFCSNSVDDPQQSVVEFESDSPVIADNVFVNNACPALFIAAGSVYNNTMVGNQAGILVSSLSSSSPVSFSNNLIAFNNYGLWVLHSSSTLPTWSHNLVYGNVAADYQGVSSQTGTNGNISSDPVLKYWLGGDVHLLSTSPAIDAGDSTVSQGSATDFYGNTRIYAGKSGDAAIVDIGAAESIAPDATPGVAPIINVPADQSTIQGAINAAVDGDEVLVAPGTYYEKLDFKGKAITVTSSGGAGATILDGNNGGPIVNFHTSEWIHSVLQGFTLQHAFQNDVTGFGPAVNLAGTSPTIEDNVFMANIDNVGSGGAIGGNVASPIILRNYFVDNYSTAAGTNPNCAVSFLNTSLPVVADNVFANNAVVAYCQANGGDAQVYNNTITGNLTGMYLSFSNNSSALFSNNVVAFNQTGVEVSTLNGGTLPPFSHNIVYGNTATNYSHVIDQTGMNGNLSSDPKLKDWVGGDVHLLYGSPAIDAGDNTFSQASATDFYGNTRVFAGNPGDSALVDVGAVEYQPPLVAATDGSIAVPFDVAATGTLTSANADPGEPLVFALVTLPAHGSVTITNSSTGAFQFVPAQGYLGPDSFTFQITDPYGTVSNTATEHVTVALEPPTANDGSVSTAPGIAVTGTLSTTAAYTGQILTFNLISGPAHGIVAIDISNGQFRYVPTSEYVGTDSFTFDVTDSFGAVSNTATEQVTIAELPPTANDGSVTTTPDTVVAGMLSATKAYTSQTLTFSLVSSPAHGTVTLTPSTGQFRYVPATGYAGADSFTFEVTDALGSVSNVATESVTVTDLAPTAHDAKIGVIPRQLFIDRLKASTVYVGQVLTYGVVSNPAHGTLTITNAATGAYTYKANKSYKGKDSFTFRAVDQWGTASNIATVSIKVY